MKRDTELSPRTRGILEAIVKSYIETGQPVASRTIARSYSEPLSAASIRNVMQDLDDAGYLCQPHTSAGRIPTLKAFRCYVQTLHARALQPEEVERLRTRIGSVESFGDRIELCSRILTEATRNVGIMAAIPAEAQVLDQVELVALPDRRVLVCMVMKDGSIANRVISPTELIPPEELSTLRNYINGNFTGWTLPRARAELARRLSEERARYDQLLRWMIVLFAKGLLDPDRSPELYMEGVSNLIGWQWNLTQERLREMFRALEQKQRVWELLDRFLEQKDGELCIQVGLEEAHPTLQELALIGTAVPLHNGMTAKIAVIGPMRMKYSRVMSVVLQMGQAFETVPS